MTFLINPLISPRRVARHSAAAGQVAHFLRDDREAAARVAGAGRLDGGVQRQQVGLERDLVDGLDDLRGLVVARVMS